MGFFSSSSTRSAAAATHCTIMSFCNYYYFFFFLLLVSSSWSSLLFCPSDAQQTYINNKQLDCNNNLSLTNGYLCNGPQRSCNSYLTFRSQPPYDSAMDIGSLLGSLPMEIAALNNITDVVDKIPTDTLVIVPVTCSCSGGSGGGGYYQHNSSYVLKHMGDTYFIVANDTYQGLTTCQALMSQNPVDSDRKLIPGLKLNVPLRCACPTRNQTDAGIRFLLSYLVTWGDSISSIAETFLGDGGGPGGGSSNNKEEEQNINEANEMSGDNNIIFPFTPLLVPLIKTPQHPTITKTTPNPLFISPPPNTIFGGTPSTKTASEGGLHLGSKIMIGVFAGVGVVGGLLLLIFLWLIYRKNHQMKDKERIATGNPNVEQFLATYGCLSLQTYKYKDIKKMTNSFKDKLGQGGYGSVFKGKLVDGRLVAVKVLINDPKRDNGEDFMNEVATIGRTNHVNVVSLLGYCASGSKRALVYEFMPNGSLEKFIYAKKEKSIIATTPEITTTTVNVIHWLGWEKLYQIALGIARGLEYLHRGCSTGRILHFDIKPHNILLDEHFCPKISDFGLAKLCPTRESIVSMHGGGRGTVGYIAPEVYCRNFGGVSYKSDVYSYGMMVLEMVGGRKNIDPFVDNTSEIYFPHWIYDHLEEQNDKIEDLLRFEGEFEEEIMARKMIIAGLWCVQTNPSNRPSMSRVSEMLEGRLEDLKMPPKPIVESFPPRASSVS